jgi:hypothetical protein
VLTATLRAFLSVANYSTLLFLALQHLQPPPGEEVRRVAVVLPGARPGRRVLVPHQRGLLAEVTQGAVVTIRADIADVQPGLVGGPGRVCPNPPLPWAWVASMARSSCNPSLFA